MRVRLSAFLSAPVVVYFYGADRAPGPTTEARGFRDSWLRLSGKVGMVLGVSSDDRISHRDFATEERLPFLLVADERRAIAKAFGVPLDGDRNKATTFVIGKDGKVLSVFPDVDPERQTEQVLESVSR
jgi:peroxiredoxin Q/BCP